ncbi:CPBP family intramembrane glutamic endopeptidase [Paenisporosarcina indica]|uniref:CPBP family intramembrane glutamic endopeptidase n=1 Tax=Paenisporosarcina indica TaxID=650093 RepID=UPI00094F59AD|nr:type II CAAX endopeptidase family protein [Paenisporosarcina indica]
MKNVLYLFGPTLMIFIGLSYYESIPITFALFYGWLFFIPFISYLKRDCLKESFFHSFTNGISAQTVWIGIVSGVICLIAIFSAVSILQGRLFETERISEVLVDWGFTGSQMWGFILVLIFFNPFLEEWYWREFMHTRLIPILGRTKTVVVTSFFYSLYHLLSLIPLFAMPFSLIAAVPVFLVGLVWGYFKVKLSTITTSVISHVLADVGIVIAYLYHFM